MAIRRDCRDRLHRQSRSRKGRYRPSARGSTPVAVAESARPVIEGDENGGSGVPCGGTPGQPGCTDTEGRNHVPCSGFHATLDAFPNRVCWTDGAAPAVVSEVPPPAA